MEKNGLETEKMIQIRRNIHQNAEGAFEEFKTQALIKKTLLEMGIEEENIKVCFNTGLVVDIKGQKEEETEESVKCIAIRADIDALPMPENNEKLPYRS